MQNKQTNQALIEPPLLKGFIPREELQEVRRTGELRIAHVYFYPECANYCLFCAYGDNRAIKRRELTLDDYAKLFGEISDLGVKTIFTPGMGEPLLRREGNDFIRFVEDANSHGLHVIVISSLNPEPSDDIVAKLQKLDISIIAKLESMNPELFKRIVRPRSSLAYKFVEIPEYGFVTAGLKKLMDAGFNIPDSEGRLRLGSGTVVHNQNLHEAENIFRFYRDHNIWPYMQGIAPLERAKDVPDLYRGFDKLALFRRLLEIDETEYGYTWSPFERKAAFGHLYPTFIVEFGGEVKFNAFFRYLLGNVLDEQGVREGHLAEIVHSKESKWLSSMYYPIGGAEGCSSFDHSQCKKTILHVDNRIPTVCLDEDPNNYCIFAEVCTGDQYMK